MKSKAPLAMMEQLVMVLVFALAAALCLRAFLWSDNHSRQNAVRDRACLEVQNAAELIKHAPGDTAAKLAAAADGLDGSCEQGLFWVEYDENWRPVPDGGVYRLSAQGVPSDVPGLGKAEVRMTTGGEQGREILLTLFQLEVVWQEEVPPYA